MTWEIWPSLMYPQWPMERFSSARSPTSSWSTDCTEAGREACRDNTKTEEDLKTTLALPALVLLAALAGSQRIEAATEPYYAYSPSAVIQGGSFTVAGTSFNPMAVAVNISVTSGTGQRTTLAIAPLTSGQ